MKNNYFLTLLVATLFAGGFAQGQTIITEWNFDAETAEPTIGAGTLTNIGGTTNTYAAGNPATGRGYNTTAYPAQGEGSGTAGVEIAVSTVGQSNIGITFDHRSSGTNSRWAQYEYTTDGMNWIVAGNNNGALAPHDTFTSVEVNLTACTACNNNANFKFRVVSIFSPLAFNQNTTLSYGPNEAYMRSNIQAQYTPEPGGGTGNYGTAGTWRFDNIKVIGNFIMSADSFNQNMISMYPNPSNAIVNFSQAISGQLLNINGQQLMSFENVSNINVSQLEAGMYFVKTNNGSTQKLMVK